MKIKVLRNLGSGWPKWMEGQEITIDEKNGATEDVKAAEKLIKAGLAERVTEAKAK